MRVKVIRQFLKSPGDTVVHATSAPRSSPNLVVEGEILEVTEGRSRELEHNKLIVPEPGSAMRAKGPAQAGTVDPTNSPPPGGPTGEASSASSSAPAPAQPARRSRGRKG